MKPPITDEIAIISKVNHLPNLSDKRVIQKVTNAAIININVYDVATYYHLSPQYISKSVIRDFHSYFIVKFYY